MCVPQVAIFSIHNNKKNQVGTRFEVQKFRVGKNFTSYLLLLLFSCQTMSDSYAASWTVISQAPLTMGFPRQQYRHGLPFPSPGTLPDPEVEPSNPALQVDSLQLSHLGSPFIIFTFVKSLILIHKIRNH